MPQYGDRRTAQMKRRRHTPEQVIRKLAEGEKLLAEGKNIDEVVRHLEITKSTWRRWRNQYGGMKANDAKKLKELERENTRLKRMGLPRVWLSPNLTSIHSQEGCAPCPKPFPPSSIVTLSLSPVNGKHRSTRLPRTSGSPKPPCTPGSRRTTSKRVSVPA